MTQPDKDAIVRAALAFRATYGGVLPNFAVDQIAVHAGVSRRSLRRWVAQSDAEAKPTAPPKPTSATRDTPARFVKGDPFQIREEHLVAIRSTLNLKEAHARLWPKKDSPGRVSYSTFTRHFNGLPPSIREGILNGWDAMVRHQVYLAMTAPHRNHTWHMDWTQADVWTSLPRGQVVRPWVGIIRDNATAMRLAAVAYVGRPNEDAACDLLGSAVCMREYVLDGETIAVGGVPVQLVFDNAKEHYAEAVTRGAIMLGVVLAPTKAFYKHQNGPAESTFSGLNKQLLAGLPGYTKGGDGDDGQPLLCPATPDKIDPDTVLPIEKFQGRLDEWMVEKNTTGAVHRLGDQPNLVSWRDDPTEIRWVAEETVRAMMLRASTPRAVNAEGIRFRGRDYLAPELNAYREKGLKVTVRYLTRETRFIEVFDGNSWICRAYDRTLLTEAQRRAILQNRERDLALLKRVNAAAVQDRIHRNLTSDDGSYDGQIDAKAQQAVDEAISEVANLDDHRGRTSDQKSFEPPETPRQDPTTPQRRKRQIAPSRTESEHKRRGRKTQDSKDRIRKRPGSDFGGINDD